MLNPKKSQPLIDVDELNRSHRLWTVTWHINASCSQDAGPWSAIEANHFNNFALWHEEDFARRDDIPLERVRDAKRNIDRFNQARNDAMEKIDDYILSALPKEAQVATGCVPHSETIGMMIDRLSIMALKEYHMAEQAVRQDAGEEHRQRCASRVALLQEQRKDLTEALRLLLDGISTGLRRFKVYRQLKMYNDPTLNPQLYIKSVPLEDASWQTKQ
jgi:hypothetical protein